MSSIQDFVYLLLYAAIFMVATTMLFLMLGTSKTKDQTMSDTMSDKTSISMSAYEGDNGYGRNNVKGEDKDYTRNQQKRNMTVIDGNDVYLDIIAVIDAFTPEDIERYETGQLKIYVRTDYIEYATMLNIKNKRQLTLKNLKAVTTGNSYQRVYKYDKDLNVIAINYQ